MPPVPRPGRRTTRWLVMLLAVAATVLAGGTAAVAAPDTTYLRLAHLSPDTPAVDVYVVDAADAQSRVVLRGVAYGSVSDYQLLSAGSYTVSMRPAGAAESTPAVISTTLRADPGAAYTVAGVGAFVDLGLTVLDDDLTLPPAGQARIRVVQASAAQPQLDIGLSDGTSIASDVPFATTTSYTTVPAGDWTLTAGAPGQQVDSTLPVSVTAGSVYSVLVLDSPTGLTVSLQVDAAGTAVVPAGGMQTGGGGAADAVAGRHHASTSPVLAVVPLVLLVLLAAGSIALVIGRAGGAAAPAAAGSTSGGSTTGTTTPSASPDPVAQDVATPVWSPTTPDPHPIAAAATTAATPLRVAIESIGVDGAVVDLDVDADGALTPPTSPDVAGWIATGPTPGQIGPAVIAGRVDSPAGPGIFYYLEDVAVGTRISTAMSDGSTATFTVVSVQDYPASSVPTDAVYGPTPDRQLRLITIGQTLDRSRRAYGHDIVVYAELTTPPPQG